MRVMKFRVLERGMSNLYRLVGVGNAELVAGLSALVRQSNELTAQVLAHLVELDERRLHLELGFSSLFAYCVEGLGMSEGAAGRRVTAARLCRRFPDAFERVARGELHLCALCALAPHLNEQNAAELFEASKGKTRRQIEELLAARFPRPDVREQIRRLPAQATQRSEQPVEGALESSRIAADSAPSRVEASAAEPRERPRARELEPLSAERFGVHFTADVELRDLIERARELASHRVPQGDLAGLMKLMVASFVEQEEKRRFGIGTRPRRSGRGAKTASAEERTTQLGPVRDESAAPPGGATVASSIDEASRHAGGATPSAHGPRTRYVRVQVRRAVHVRDEARCAYVAADGRRCGARTMLQFDHLEPFARNGSSDAPNLRLLCKAHNLLHARKCFGAAHVEAKIAARSSRDSGSRSR
jgi:hypothetical protein